MSNTAIGWVRDHGGRRCGSNADVAVLLLLADRANDCGITWVTHEALVESLPTSRRQTVSEACRRLIEAEVVDAFTVNRGARTRQLLRVGAGALGVVPAGVTLPDWCRFGDLPTGWTSSTPERAGSSTVERTSDAQESSTVESAGASTVERTEHAEPSEALQHAQASPSSTVERESPARLSVPNPKENPQGTHTLPPDGGVTGVAEVDGFEEPFPVRTRGVLITDEVVAWAVRVGLASEAPRAARDRAVGALRTIGMVLGDGKEATHPTVAVCGDYLADSSGGDVSPKAWGQLRALVRDHGGLPTVDALAEATVRGVGHGTDDPASDACRYAASVLRAKDAA